MRETVNIMIEQLKPIFECGVCTLKFKDETDLNAHTLFVHGAHRGYCENPKGSGMTKIRIEAEYCKGCGLCVASCRSGAIQQKGFETEQIMSMIGSSLID